MATQKNAAGSAKAGTDGADSPEAADTSKASISAQATQAAQAAWVGGLEYPVEVTLRNNGHVAVAEPATRQFLAAGGSAVVTIHDETLATLLVQNLAELNAVHFANQALLAIDGVDPEVLLKGE